jgi:ribosome-associated toxin RatA of RatAB toxin-antitoxin module
LGNDKDAYRCVATDLKLMESRHAIYYPAPAFSIDLVSAKMKILRRRCFIYAVLLCWPAQASEMPGVTANVEHQDSKIKVTASVILPVQPCGAFRLMTDYDSLPKYIPGILETRHEYIKDDMVKVWQTGDVKIWFFRFKMKSLLEMHEVPDQKISFRQLEGDLDSYSGEWELQEDTQGTRVLYMAELTFRHFMPIFLARMVLEDEIKKRFAAIAREADARKNMGLMDCSPEKN